MVKLELSYPPSINHYYKRSANGGLHISSRGKEYRTETFWKVKQLGLGAGFGCLIAMEIHAYPPDNRKRDIDNINKALLDALQHAGLYTDDSLIVKLLSIKYAPVKDGKIVVKIKKTKQPEAA